MKKILTFLLIGIFIFSCSNDDGNKNTIDYSEYITEKSIATEINFMAEEIYSDMETVQTPLLKLKLITKEQFPCVNYSLKTTEFLNGNELIVRFDEILKPAGCYTAVGPAISYIDLPENINKLTLINGNIIDKYSLDIDIEKVKLTLIENNFTHSLYKKTFRIPKNSFAYVCGTNTTNTYIYENFLTILRQNTDFSEFEFNGEGRIPYPDSSNGHWVNHPSKFFIYSKPTEFENLKTVLDNYSTQNIEENSGATIAIYGWNNLRYYSWN